MKKRFVSLCLAGLIMVAPASAVFTDISDSRVSQTAAVLDALGIMQGVGGGSFAPGKALTRAQFCKLAVTAMGVTDVSPYASYTIFPDVKHSHWAAPYINAVFDGNPFIRYAKDNDGGLYFETEAGLYPMDETEGLPSPVDRYYRRGRTFIYSRSGKWGVCQKLVKSGTNVFRPPVYRYLEILPARFDRIRYVCGDGAHHFVAKVAGKWQLYDGWGRVRHMCIGEFDRHRMNIYSPSAAGESSVTGTYINRIVSIPVGCTGKYIPYLMTRCTYTGTDEAGIIELESHEDRYSSFFTTQDDRSTYPMPWDEADINAEYHY